MSYTCPSSCTGTCPEIVPVTINQTTLEVSGTDVSQDPIYLTGADFTDNGDGTSHYDLPYTPLVAKQFRVYLNGTTQGEDSAGAQANFSLSGDILTLNFVPAAGDLIQLHYWYATP